MTGARFGAYAHRVSEEATRLNINLPAELVGGVWANYAQVSHSPFEFTFDFARLDFSQANDNTVPGQVVARVNMSPLLVSQLIDALQSNWKSYAEKALPKEVRDGNTDDLE